MAEHVFTDYFYGIDALDRAYGDTLGQLKAMKIGLVPKKPDKSKVKAMIEKAAKSGGKVPKGTFVLERDGDVISFQVRVGTGSGSKLELGKLDIGAVKDLVKRRDLMFQLNIRGKLYSDADLEAFDKKHADVEDRPEAVEMGKRIDKLKNAVDNLQIMRGNYTRKEYNPYSSEFTEWIKKKGHTRYKAFVDDVEDGRSLTSDARKLFDDPKTSGMKAATFAAIKAAWDKGETPDYKPARKEVMLVVMGLLAQYNKEKIAESDKEIKTALTEIAGLQKQLKVMKAD
jgi:hypothetical protein